MPLAGDGAVTARLGGHGYPALDSGNGSRGHLYPLTGARQELAGDGIVVSVAYPYITLTAFERNTIRAIPVPEDKVEPTGPYPSDPVEFVAERLLEGILTGEAEIFSHEWQKNRGRDRG